VSQSLLPLGTRCGFWRAPNSCSHAFVVQSFLHELSVAAQRDHVEFLLEVMGDPRWLPPGEMRTKSGEGDAFFSAVKQAGYQKNGLHCCASKIGVLSREARQSETGLQFNVADILPEYARRRVAAVVRIVVTQSGSSQIP